MTLDSLPSSPAMFWVAFRYGVCGEAHTLVYGMRGNRLPRVICDPVALQCCSRLSCLFVNEAISEHHFIFMQLIQGAATISIAICDAVKNEFSIFILNGFINSLSQVRTDGTVKTRVIHFLTPLQRQMI